MSLRVRGDGTEYVRIASRFDSLSSAVGYVGNRTVGMPLLNYALRPKAMATKEDVEGWIESVCTFLFVAHMVSSAAFVWTARQYAVVRSRRSLRFLFFFLVSFPAFVGHTSVPLTDTIAVDIALMSFTAMAVATTCSAQKPLVALFMGCLAGLFAAYSTLLRPSFLYPTLVSAAVHLAVNLSRARPIAPHSLAACIALYGTIAIVATRCARVYGTLCVQNPATFGAVVHAQMGLRGGRLLWNGVYPANGEFPVLSDALLAPRFYSECRLDRMLGLGDNSLSGCLLQRAHLVPVYVAKKWAGLFDHFRFQPYVEAATPTWLCALSRTYDGILIAGVFFAVWEASLYLLRRRLARVSIGGACLASFVTFSVLNLAEHTLLHPEDRFSFPVIPCAAIWALRLVERIHDDIVQKRTASACACVAGASVSVVAFAVQVLAWDRTGF